MNKSITWLTTMPNPCSPAHTARVDGGQVGWKLHLVRPGIAVRKAWPFGWTHRDEPQIDVSPALCGLIPKHGWGLDLFVDMPCRRCLRSAEKMSINIHKVEPTITSRTGKRSNLMIEYAGTDTLQSDLAHYERTEEAAEERYRRELKAHPLEDYTEQAEANLRGDFGFNDYMEMNCIDAMVGICEHVYLYPGNDLAEHIKNIAEYGMHRELWLHGERARLQKEEIEGIFR